MPLRPRPAWLTAVAAQALGWLATLGLARLGWLESALTLLAAQAIIAATSAAMLRSERWWIVIHLLFSPLLAAALSLNADPRWAAAIFALLLLIFWGTLNTRVPLYLSGREVATAIEALLPPDRPARMLDLGCGTGSVIAPLAQQRPNCHFHGIESAPAPWVITHLRSRTLPNLSVERGDFFSADWRGYDVIYAFLSPHPMAAVWAKACTELGPQALLISKDFPVAGAEPARSLRLPSGSTLYLYYPGRTD